jgi:AraC-like DNA-binding protein/mannose-6-phosphate isomerase-like protein (cupin superfamily)
MEREWIQFALPSLSFHIQSLKMDTGNTYKGMHQHGAVELIQVEAGSLLCHLGQDTLTLTTDQILLINSHTVHWLEPLDFAEVTYVQVDITKFRTREQLDTMEMLDEFIAQQQVKAYGIFDSRSEVCGIFKNMKTEVETKGNAYDSYLKAHIYLLMAFMQRQGLLVQRNISEIKGLAELLPVACYIEEHYVSKLTLDELGKIAGFDKYRLCRSFKQLTGGTVVEYCNFVRLRQAEYMLRNTSYNVSETAFACGFTSIQYFNKVFKRYLGCSPSEYKRWILL